LGCVNILAIETATTACGVGVRTSNGVELVRVVNDDRRHTESLAPAMRELLEEVQLAARDVTHVVVDRGPGLFTGLRVGIATAIAFSEGVGCALVGVTSLELLAHGAYDAGVRGTLVSCVDGRRGEIFVQTFTLDGGVRVMSEPGIGVASDVVAKWVASTAPVTFTGDGVARYAGDFQAVANASVFLQSVPSLRAALDLGERRDRDEILTPLYLREADAVANFTTRERSS
jgi:tRNA threonylcarbamoyladenosine biosynthesis protein TsaB